MARWSEQDLAQVNARLQQQIGSPFTPAPQSKYGNQKVWHNGQRFDSKLERQWWKNFELQRLAGDIRAVIRQVSLPLPGSGRRMRVDFVVIELTGNIRWIDAKGYPTKEWLLKRDIIEQAYGIRIETC